MSARHVAISVLFASTVLLIILVCTWSTVNFHLHSLIFGAIMKLSQHCCWELILFFICPGLYKIVSIPYAVLDYIILHLRHFYLNLSVLQWSCSNVHKHDTLIGYIFCSFFCLSFRFLSSQQHSSFYSQQLCHHVL